MKIRIFLVFILLFAAYVANAFIDPFPAGKVSSRLRSNNNVKYGVSWSFEQAGWYGLDPRESYVALLDRTKFDWVRLPFFWDQMTDSYGNLKIDDLKFAIEEARKRNIKVIIALGAKTPYYPEYHFPKGILERVKFGDTFNVDHLIVHDLLEIDKKLVGELSGYDNIVYWQVENEPFLANVNNWKIDKNLLAAEIDVVRNTDAKKRPIILTTASHPSFDKRYEPLLELLKPEDVLGTSAYFKIKGVYLFAFPFFSKKVVVPWPNFLDWPVDSWLFLSPDYRGVIKDAAAKNIDVWAIEVQADPYIRILEDAKRNNFSFNADDITKADRFIRSIGFRNVGLWGGPFWMYRESIGDKSWIDAISRLTIND